MLIHIQLYGCHIHTIFTLRSETLYCLATGYDSRFSVKMPNSTIMKSTTAIAATGRSQQVGRALMSAAASVINTIFSRRVSAAVAIAGTAAKKSAGKLADVSKSADICNDFHLKQATESPTAKAAGLFCGRGSCHIHSSVPCGALMRPLPVSRWKATGSGTFSVSGPQENSNIFRFI